MKDASKAATANPSKTVKTQPYTDSPMGTRNTNRTSVTATYVQELLKNTLVMQGLEKCKAGNGEEQASTVQ